MLIAAFGGAGALLIALAGTHLGAAMMLREVVWSINPAQPVDGPWMMQDGVLRRYAPLRFMTQLLSVFGALSLGLCLIGVYGLVTQAVASRKFDVGLRMALGASTRNILGLAVRIGLVPVLRGMVIGTASALLLSSVLKDLLFEVSASDPTTFAFVVLGMSGAGAAAAIIPARRVTRIEPSLALRAQ